MARYTGPVCKLCRREGEKLFLKGSRCLSPKCSVERRTYPPGEHGRDTQFRRGRASDYALQLREKQKARRIYGILERQFRRYFRIAQSGSGLTGSNLLILLESRLDNVVYRMRFADSRNHARQLVQHGHFAVNGVKMTAPSYLVQPGDIVTVREGSRKRKYFREMSSYMEERPPSPEWVVVDGNTITGTIDRMPERREIDSPINEQLIVEYYSR
ncbi:MAG: 30S ribosomal protein S4 [Chloroflexi bacterium]|jgi:small subunit ribosomal protein S4|nr:30S ribosomal protein S4 [Chloroflexota bacterium]